MTRQRYTILGAGAMGGSLAFYLAEAGHHVQVVDTDDHCIETIHDRGIAIERADGEREFTRLSGAYSCENAPTNLDNVILAVKSQHTANALDWLAPRLSPHGWVMSLQNGLNETFIAKAVGADRTIGCFVNMAADAVAPAVLRVGGRGALRVGELDGRSSGRVEEIAADISAWAPAEVTANVYGYLWSKLIYGLILVGTAVCDDPMAVTVRKYPQIFEALVTEGIDLADRVGVRLESFDHFHPDLFRMGDESSLSGVATYLDGLDKKHSGYWRDLAVHRRTTEVSAHYGPVLVEGDRIGLPLPRIRALTRTIRALESGELERGPKALAELV